MEVCIPCGVFNGKPGAVSVVFLKGCDQLFDVHWTASAPAGYSVQLSLSYNLGAENILWALEQSGLHQVVDGSLKYMLGTMGQITSRTPPPTHTQTENAKWTKHTPSIYRRHWWLLLNGTYYPC